MFKVLTCGAVSEETKKFLQHSKSISFEVATRDGISAVILENEKNEILYDAPILDMSQMVDGSGLACVHVRTRESSYILSKNTLADDQAYSLALRMFIL